MRIHRAAKIKENFITTGRVTGLATVLATVLALGLLLMPGVAVAKDITTSWSGAQYGVGDITSPLSVTGGTLNVDPGDGVVGSGQLYGGASQMGSADNNTVIIKSGSSTSNIYGGYTTNGAASGTRRNKVTIHKGSWGNVYGGFGGQEASNNHIILYAGSVTGVLAGWAHSTGQTDNNIVDVYRGVGFSGIGGASLKGGGNLISGVGNTLNLFGWQGYLTVLEGFQKINFYLPETAEANDFIIGITTSANIKNAIINVGFQGGTALKVGSNITLIDATSSSATLTTGNNNAVTTGQGMVGLSKTATFNITYDTNMVYATLVSLEEAATSGGGQVGTQLKALVEPRISGLGMLTMGSDLLGARGVPQLRAQAKGMAGGANAPAAFGVMGGSSLRFNSGSHVDVDGFNLSTGLGWSFPQGENGASFLVGPFFEAGWGSYDSHNSFSGGSVNGDGDTSYYGLGVLARYDFAPTVIATLPGVPYIEGSIRAGKVKTDYDSSDFLTASGEDVSYDSSVGYYGLHLGGGYEWNISDATTLDMYTRYIWTRQDSDSFTIEGDKFRFKATDSQRWRTGAKLAHSLANGSGLIFTPYVGAAFEYEFDSKAKATVNGDSISSPDVKGGTGIGEAGLSFKPSAESGLSIGLGVSGYVGKREGVGGDASLRYEF